MTQQPGVHFHLLNCHQIHRHSVCITMGMTLMLITREHLITPPFWRIHVYVSKYFGFVDVHIVRIYDFGT